MGDTTGDNDGGRITLIEAATELYLKHGYSAITLDDIAARAGMSKKAFYRFFASREELLAAVVREAMRRTDSAVKAVYHDPSQPYATSLARLLTAATGPFTYVCSPQRQRAFRYSVPQAWHEFDAWKSSQSRLIDGFLRDGINGGFIRSDLGVHSMLVAYINMTCHCAEYMRHPDRPRHLADLHTDFIDIYLNGVLTNHIAEGTHDGTHEGGSRPNT